jgi:hypothetical protein
VVMITSCSSQLLSQYAPAFQPKHNSAFVERKGCGNLYL